MLGVKKDSGVKKKVQTIRKPPSLFEPQAMITITIGQQKFCVHEALIAYHSADFKAGSIGPTIEHDPRTMNINHCDLEERRLFGVFVHWLYHQEVEIPDDVLYPGLIKEAETARTLINAWKLGKRIMAPKFQNDIIDRLFRIVRCANRVVLQMVLMGLLREDANTAPAKLILDHVALLASHADFEFVTQEFVGVIDGGNYWMWRMLREKTDIEALSAKTYHEPMLAIKSEDLSGRIMFLLSEPAVSWW